MEITTRRKILILLLLFISTVCANSAAKTDNPSLQSLRQDFLAAEQALGRDDAAFQALKARLDAQDYPLLPYLKLKEHLNNLSALKSDQVELFLATYSDTPLANRLHSAWLKHLAKKKRWWTYRAFYKPTRSTSQQCTYLWALFNTGKAQEAMKKAVKVWLSGSSQPKACDPMFEVLQDNDLLTEKLVWARIDLAMEQRSSRLARYLGRFLPKPEQSWLNQWLDIHRHPATRKGCRLQ
ncbi:hypothetical protein [Solemya velesiana gill symbiont]|uniref:Lytic murein transglycosylase n=1 Tax=Solemya velesiana gill symbiont TaxID=1918948 RepID=A0A1T2KWJ8_9GAMM|nr:hypothetical protein [Solemya velesiana gill symbiont]OOZ37194.1 hypothetical protein BOW51_03505 [Solemya velesiana gill symbiont]